MDIKMNLLLIFTFSLMVMQPGLGHILPLEAKDDDKATAPKATEAATRKATDLVFNVTVAPPTQMPSTAKPEKLTATTTKGTTAATTKKAVASSLKGVGKKGFIGSLLDMEYPMWRSHHKRRCHGPAPPTKAPLATTTAPKPNFYYNMVPPMMEGGYQEVNYGLPNEFLSPELTEELGGEQKHSRKHKPSPSLPPLINMLNHKQQQQQQQQHHREKSPLLDFLDDVMDMVTSNNTKGIDTKPFGYFNKMVSPDGKHEMKEFGLVAPNMMIEGVQQEHNFDLSSDALLPEHHCGMSSENLTPEFVPIKPKNFHHREKLPSRRDFLDGGIDAALRKNYDLIERLLEDLEQEDDLLQVIKDATEQMKKAKKEKRYLPKEELIVTCPIHHEHHPNRNGEMIEEDVVQVNECEAVKVLD